MKKYVISLLVLSALFTGANINKVTANDVTVNDLSSIEAELFNQTYNNESINNRLDKIEKMIYGKNFNHSDLNERINNLSPFIPTNNKTNKTSPPVIEDNAASSTPLPKLNKTGVQIKQTDYLKGSLPPRKNTIFTEEPKNISTYPSIDKAELILLGQVFPQDNIYKRVERLESETNILKPAKSLDRRMHNIEKQIHYLSLKEQYSNERNVKKQQPDINIMPEPISNHHYNKNFSNGVQDQYINPINYSNNYTNKYPANMPANNMNNNGYMHQASYQNAPVQPNKYAALVPYSTQDLRQTATSAVIDNTVGKKPGLWSKITRIGRMTKNAIFDTSTVEDYNYYPPVY